MTIDNLKRERLEEDVRQEREAYNKVMLSAFLDFLVENGVVNEPLFVKGREGLVERFFHDKSE